MKKETILTEVARRLLVTVCDIRSASTFGRIVLEETPEVPDRFDGAVLTGNDCTFLEVNQGRKDEEILDWAKKNVLESSPAIIILRHWFPSNSKMWTVFTYIPNEIESKNLIEFNYQRKELIEFFESIVPVDTILLSFLLDSKDKLEVATWKSACKAEGFRSMLYTSKELRYYQDDVKFLRTARTPIKYGIPSTSLSEKASAKFTQFLELSESPDCSICLEIEIKEDEDEFSAEFQEFAGPNTALAVFNQIEPRYYLIRCNNITALICWYPESATKRLCFLYAGTQANLSTLVTKAGVPIQRKRDIRHARDSISPLFTTTQQPKGRLLAYSSSRPRKEIRSSNDFDFQKPLAYLPAKYVTWSLENDL